MLDSVQRRKERTVQGASAVPWTGLALSVVSLATLVTVTLIARAELGQLRSRNSTLASQADSLAVSNAALASEQAELRKRLEASEKRCAALEARIPDEARLRELAAPVARETAAARPRRRPARRPAGEVRAEVDKHAADIAAIREKVKKGEMTEEQGRKAIAARFKDGLKAMVPGEALERMERARAEREKNMTPEEKKQAARGREAFLDGIAEWAEVHKQVKEGKITREEARRIMREKWRARAEEFRRRREAKQKPPEAKEEF
jgi:polyhydroxyalkanoate synthesis regulator phasin